MLEFEQRSINQDSLILDTDKNKNIKNIWHLEVHQKKNSKLTTSRAGVKFRMGRNNHDQVQNDRYANYISFFIFFPPEHLNNFAWARQQATITAG